MKFLITNVLIIILFFLTPLVFAQDIQVITHGTTKYEPVGTFEIVFDFEVLNISSFDSIAIFEVRTINNLPQDWTSSLCFGLLCFPPDFDSVATTPDFNTPPIAQGDTLETSLHVFTDQISIATAYVQIQVGTFRHPEDRIILNFTATTDPAVSVNENNTLNTYYLFQNYPNPFNPSTKISYKVGEPGIVQLKVYNVLGVEVADLVNEYESAGNYSADFNALNLSSGVYFYSLTVNNFTQTRKMILEK
jgi:hypothetical protein